MPLARDLHCINTEVIVIYPQLRPSTPGGPGTGWRGRGDEGRAPTRRQQGMSVLRDALGNYSGVPLALVNVHRNYTVAVVTILILLRAVESHLIDTTGHVDGQTV